jgi:hypothetical protein
VLELPDPQDLLDQQARLARKARQARLARLGLRAHRVKPARH